jgi:hypothetical protein
MEVATFFQSRRPLAFFGGPAIFPAYGSWL